MSESDPATHEDAPPCAISDWDAYWVKELADDYWRRAHRRRSISPFLKLIEGIPRSSWRRVLVVGCGISTEPALLARLGYEVVAIDVSAVAVGHIQLVPASAAELASWLVPHLPDRAWITMEGGGGMLALEGRAREEALGETLQRLSRDTGSLITTCVDFRDFTTDEPFDVVYCPWSWQCLDSAGRAALPHAVNRWLAPGGAAFFATQNVSSLRSDELSSACASAGLLRRHDEALTLLAKRWPKNARQWRRHHERCADDDERMRRKLAAGSKMWDSFSASG